MTTMVEPDSTQDDARTDLSDLVRDRRAALNLSLAAVAERTAETRGGEPVIKRSTLDNLEKASPRMAWTPRLRDLKALARALDLDLGRVKDAAGSQFFGIDTVWSASGEARALVERAERFTPEQREQLMRLLDTFERSPRAE